MNTLVSQAASAQVVPTGKKQKSISGLIRATRRSTRHSSIIRRNGSIIIVKGGKIVSVRRQDSFQRSGSPVDREVNGKEEDGASKTQPNGHPNNADPSLSKDDLEGQDVTVWKRKSGSSEGSDSVFDDRQCSLATASDVACESPLEMISEEKRLLSQMSDTEQECESSLSRNEAGSAVPKASQADRESCTGEDRSFHARSFKTDVGIIINIDDDDSILDIMPLTPRTRDRIAHSDLYLDNWDKASAGPLTKLKTSHGSQGLSKRSLQRLPSVEYLDPPVSLKRSSSDNNVQTSRKPPWNIRTLKIPTLNSSRWSFGRRF